MEMDQKKSTVADPFVGERPRNIEGGSGGYGRENAGIPSRGVQWASRERDRTIFPERAIPSGQRGDYKSPAARGTTMIMTGMVEPEIVFTRRPRQIC